MPTDPTIKEVIWDPRQYLRYADHRGRPFHDLLARVPATDPGYVVDLGCGPGTLTAGLCDRWPGAYVEGLDASAEMIDCAHPLAVTDRLEFGVVDVRDWKPSRPVDVLLSNAMLQWVPEHPQLLERLVDSLAPGGWLAFQVPGNFQSPSHRLLRDLAAEDGWSPKFAGTQMARPMSAEPSDYLGVLAAAGCEDIDVWETTYLYLLQGTDPVFEWVKGTAARPYLQALAEADRPGFEAAYRDRLRQVYPTQSFGTVLPYRRIFAIARRSAQ